MPNYCLLSIHQDNELPSFSTALCLPKTCTRKMIQALANSMLDQSEVQQTRTTGGAVKCIDDQRPKRTRGFKFMALSMAGIILLVVVLSTGLHVYKRSCNREIGLLGSSFSLLQNVPKLFEGKGGARNLESLNGLRVLSSFLICVMHIDFYCTRIALSMDNRVEYDELKSSLFQLALLQTQLGVDTFFFISGFCLAYGFMRARSQG